jgi:hypothetical protein
VFSKPNNALSVFARSREAISAACIKKLSPVYSRLFKNKTFKHFVRNFFAADVFVEQSFLLENPSLCKIKFLIT